MTSREATQAVFENYNAKPPRKHLPSFEATHSNSDTTRQRKEKREHRRGFNKISKANSTSVTLGHLPLNSKWQPAQDWTSAMRAKANDLARDNIATHNVLIKGEHLGVKGFCRAISS